MCCQEVPQRLLPQDHQGVKCSPLQGTQQEGRNIEEVHQTELPCIMEGRAKAEVVQYHALEATKLGIRQFKNITGMIAGFRGAVVCAEHARNI